jgi:hypothetical protein
MRKIPTNKQQTFWRNPDRIIPVISGIIIGILTDAHMIIMNLYK